MTTLIYLKWPAIGKKISIARHFASLQAILLNNGIDGAVMQYMAANPQELAQALAASGTPAGNGLVYIIGHSTLEGFVCEDSRVVKPGEFVAMLPRQKSRRPAALILNTCYGQTNGMAQAAREAGIEFVAAAEGPIAIDDLPQTGETFLKAVIDFLLPALR